MAIDAICSSVATTVGTEINALKSCDLSAARLSGLALALAGGFPKSRDARAAGGRAHGASVADSHSRDTTLDSVTALHSHGSVDRAQQLHDYITAVILVD